MGVGALAEATQQDLTGVIESAAAGDEMAFARIVDAYLEDMRRVCAEVCADDVVAEDAVPAFEAHVSEAYESAFERKPDIYACHVADGVGRVQ